MLQRDPRKGDTSLSSNQINKPDLSSTLGEAVYNAGIVLGLSLGEIDEIVKSDARFKYDVIPASREGFSALSLVRIYRRLYAMFDGNKEHMQLWMAGFNNGSRGVPIEQVKHDDGLLAVVEYLEARQGY